MLSREGRPDCCVCDYRRRHPGMEVNLMEDGGLRLADRLERGDLALVVMCAVLPSEWVSALSRRAVLARRP